MGDATAILEALNAGDAAAAERLLPLVYEELRRLASQRLRRERPGHTLQTTALVHEAYLRLVDVERAQRWHSVGHFFAAAAEAMRRILVEHARAKRRLKRGGGRPRADVELGEVAVPLTSDEILDLNEALDALAAVDEPKARLVTMRWFGGMEMEEAAQVLGVSRATAQRWWVFARAWLRERMRRGSTGA
jgi:RNA polymerase sigma factor (TIGR02999 family)